MTTNEPGPERIRLINDRLATLQLEIEKFEREKAVMIQIEEYEEIRNIDGLLELLSIYPEFKIYIENGIKKCCQTPTSTTSSTTSGGSSLLDNLDNYDINYDLESLNEVFGGFGLEEEEDEEESEQFGEEQEEDEDEDFLESRVPVPIPSEIKSKLKVMRFKTNNALIQYDSCQICLSKYRNNRDNVYVLPCNHVFHQSCGGRWFSGNCKCPICKRDMRSLTH